MFSSVATTEIENLYVIVVLHSALIVLNWQLYTTFKFNAPKEVPFCAATSLYIIGSKSCLFKIENKEKN